MTGTGMPLEGGAITCCRLWQIETSLQGTLVPLMQLFTIAKRKHPQCKFLGPLPFGLML